jgi:hypothetical protein
LPEIYLIEPVQVGVEMKRISPYIEIPQLEIDTLDGRFI